ncbi:hypothetical protein Esti_003905 [Eimeria stiedai]
MESLLSSEASALSKGCKEVHDQALPSLTPSACRYAAAGTHALHHLLTAIAAGRVTAVDLRKAVAAKSRSQAACVTSSSSVASSSPTKNHIADSHRAVHVHHSIRPQSESLGVVPSGWTCAECCSLELPPPQVHEFYLQHDCLGAEAAEAAEVESVVHAVVYDEQRLLRCFALLNFHPSHVLHLCFWAASRTLLSHPNACEFNASLFFRLFAAVFPASDARQLSQTLTAPRVAGEGTTPATNQAAAAAEYLHDVLVIPFLLWWKSLLGGLSNSQEALSGEEAAMSMDGGKRTGRCVHVSDLHKKAEKKRRRGDDAANGSHRGRRARLTTWQAVLSLIIEKKREACENACAENDGAAKDSKSLSSVLFPPWKSSESTANEQLDDWYMTLADGGLSRHPKESSFLRELASLQHAREHLTLKCVFSGPASKDHDSKVSNTADFSTLSPNSRLKSRASVGGSAEGRFMHVPHDRISSWIAWALHRHELLAASSGH